MFTSSIELQSRVHSNPIDEVHQISIFVTKRNVLLTLMRPKRNIETFWKSRIFKAKKKNRISNALNTYPVVRKLCNQNTGIDNR